MKDLIIEKSGCRIHGRLYSAGPGPYRAAVICRHGFVCTKESEEFAALAEAMLPEHPDTLVLTFDLPGHGEDESEGLELEHCGVYLRAVTEFAREELGAERLYANGTSFGGYLILKYVLEHGNPFWKIALRCPVIDMAEVLTEKVMTPEDRACLQKTGSAVVGFAVKTEITEEFLSDLRAAALTERDFSAVSGDIGIVHGTADEIVPFAAVETFAEKNGIRFLPVPGADHRFLDPEKLKIASEAAIALYAQE